MKRRTMTIEEIRAESDLNWIAPDEVETAGIMALVEVENMGWTKDGRGRWYTCEDANGRPAIYYKH